MVQNGSTNRNQKPPPFGPTPPPKPLDYQDHCHGLAETRALASPWVLPPWAEEASQPWSPLHSWRYLKESFWTATDVWWCLYPLPACADRWDRAEMQTPWWQWRCVNTWKAAGNTEAWEMESAWKQSGFKKPQVSLAKHVMTQHQISHSETQLKNC